MALTTTATAQGIVGTKASARTAVKASSVGKAPLLDLRKRLGAPALLAGFAAAQISFFAPGPALADIGTAYVSRPSIDLISDGDVANIVTEIEDAEIPQLEISLGRLAGTAPVEAVASVQRELEAIEREAATLAEATAMGTNDDGPAAVGGILNEITAIKAMMRGME